MDAQMEAILKEMDEQIARAPAIMPLEQWREYFGRLEGPEGCDFTGEGASITWTCAGGVDQSLSKAILERMELDEETIEDVLECVSSLGGHCDCEVLFNAAERIDP